MGDTAVTGLRHEWSCLEVSSPPPPHPPPHSLFSLRCYTLKGTCRGTGLPEKGKNIPQHYPLFLGAHQPSPADPTSLLLPPGLTWSLHNPKGRWCPTPQEPPPWPHPPQPQPLTLRVLPLLFSYPPFPSPITALNQTPSSQDWKLPPCTCLRLPHSSVLFLHV